MITTGAAPHKGNVRPIHNHVLDWGRAGLRETLRVLDDAGLATAGAGADVPAEHRAFAIA